MHSFLNANSAAEPPFRADGVKLHGTYHAPSNGSVLAGGCIRWGPRESAYPTAFAIVVMLPAGTRLFPDCLCPASGPGRNQLQVDWLGAHLLTV
jgi:hypothetical protein